MIEILAPRLYVRRRGQKQGVAVRGGKVSIVGRSELAYDYEVDVRLVDGPRPRARIAELIIRARADDEVSPRRARDELPTVRRLAVAGLAWTVDRDGERLETPPREKDLEYAQQQLAVRPTLNDDQRLRRVAALYLEAERRGVPRQQHVADGLGVTRGNAGKLIHLARHKAGLLPSV